MSLNLLSFDLIQLASLETAKMLLENKSLIVGTLKSNVVKSKRCKAN